MPIPLALDAGSGGEQKIVYDRPDAGSLVDHENPGHGLTCPDPSVCVADQRRHVAANDDSAFYGSAFKDDRIFRAAPAYFFNGGQRQVRVPPQQSTHDVPVDALVHQIAKHAGDQSLGVLVSTGEEPLPNALGLKFRLDLGP